MLPNRPKQPRVASVWVNKKNLHEYVVSGFVFDATNGVETWKVRYQRRWAVNESDTTSFCRNVAEFLEKFELKKL